MAGESFKKALFDLIEHITKTELPARSKQLVLAYLDDSPMPSLAARAREAVERYTQTTLPASREGTRLDRLVAAMEAQAARHEKR